MSHLANLNWGKSFSCSRCQYREYTKGYTFLARRCKHYKYDESVTANTIFHGVKFSIVKAFLICYRMSTKKGMSSYEIAKEVDRTQKTSWIFCAKIRALMKSNGLHLLEGVVHVDECVMGGKEKGKPGRSLGKKKPVLMMVEVRGKHKTGRVLKAFYICYQVCVSKKKNVKL